MKLRILLCIMLWFGSTVLGQGVKPDKGFVPDSKTALRIAESVLLPVYGEKKIASERPFNAELKDGSWTVSGTLHCSDGNGGATTHCVGGTATVKIAKTDGRIIFMMHYK